MGTAPNLKENGIRSYIKLQDHEKRKTRAYKEDIGKYSNMTYAVFEDEHYYICHDGRELHIGKYSNMTYAVFEDEHYYICHDGRELHHIRTESKEQDGYTQTKHYRSQRI